VNPAHLFLGTNRDNMRDCAAKGRTRRTPTVEKFDATDRALIRGLIAMGATKTAVADWMGSCQATVARIANGKTFTCDR
jgi:hypothetical protein